MVKKISIALCLFTVLTCCGLMIGKYLYTKSIPHSQIVTVQREMSEEKGKIKENNSVIVEDVYADEIDMSAKDSQMTAADYSNFDTIIDDLIEATD